MGKRHYLKAINSLQSRIREHETKIQRELEQDSPDQGLIRYWQKEIAAFEKEIRQAQKRLGR
ncbi:MAG: hypothetical protein AAF827_14720 [Cyanobacteria bacterium P01_D01_bin.6]